jgi:hypothetical protein
VRNIARPGHVAGGELGGGAHIEHHELRVFALEASQQL